MPTIDSEKKQDHSDSEISEQLKVLDHISDIDIHAKKVLNKSAARRSQTVDELPKIKELKLLKEGIYSIDLEKSINDMFQVMKNMEYQLESVLKINTSLERDLKESKEIISSLNGQNSELKEKVAGMEDALPSKREFEIEVDYHIDERNKAESLIRELKSQIVQLKTGANQNQQKAGDLEEQRSDFINEINFLEARLNSDTENSKSFQKEIRMLKGRILVDQEKIGGLRNELEDSREEKYELLSELKASRTAVRELRSALADTKLQAKKTFYQHADKNRPDANKGDDK